MSAGEGVEARQQPAGGEGADDADLQLFAETAFAILDTFPAGDARTGLEQLVRFTTERNK